PGPLALGDPDGHAAPLSAGPGEARAGRIHAAQLPATPQGLVTWADGDFVLANNKIALVIEDAGPSDLYDPWGGRPVGLGRVEGGALVDPAEFGEVFLITGRSTIVTEHVTVIADGSDGGPAIVRASGRLAPLPFLDNLLVALYFDDLRDVDAAIDYVLAPDADAVDVIYRYASPRAGDTDTGAVLHGFMYTRRMPSEVPGTGFTDQINRAPWLQLVDDQATSWGYAAVDGTLNNSIAQAGFIGGFTSSFTIPGCTESMHDHAKIVIGGPGLDGLEQARARVEGRTLRAITGTVTDGTAPVAGFRVHAVDGTGAYLTRATTDATGAFTLHVPDDADVTLTAYQRGWPTATAEVAAAATTATLTVAPIGHVHVHAHDAAGGLPARVQIMPATGSSIPTVPDAFGEPTPTSGRLHVAYPIDGDVTLPVPPGDWNVVVSRGYEYELVEQAVTVTAGATTDVDALLERVVDTTDQQCGDFHIHTIRSNDSGDDATEKVRSGLADGLELPVRTDHEYVNSFQPLIEALGAERWAYGITSIEMTSFQLWGHMNVFPLEADPTKPNGGAPQWQDWPTKASPDKAVRTLGPVEVFQAVRARPEHPTIIINHPRGTSNYFDYAGLDPITGLVSHPEYWDEDFTVVEVFNDSDWLHNRDGTVRDWFNLLDGGREVYAVGSSDSHGIKSSPVGYPRTCIALGTDDPRELTPELVRDQVAGGHSFVSGGIYLDATVGAAHPGDVAAGVGATATVDLRVQAATWIDVDAIDVVVDGETIDTIPIQAGDADPTNPVVRWHDTIDVPVAANGSWVVLAAYGDQTLEPVHPGRKPFAVTNPIWLQR
ncbi:MAG: CehA/McbA family metallohydrolase, partial [Myxococcales bacterium]|nr:CehA/McbA family metallohydrolase [Myxococcales bacterium]